MQKEIFIFFFNQSISFIAEVWKNKYAELLNKEHWDIIGEKLFLFVFENEIYHNPLPVFNGEIVVDYTNVYQHFEELKFITQTNDKAQLIAKVIENTPIKFLLIILGQRKTSATITDENGIPPRRKELLKSCFEPYNEQICKAARAREKHISRNKKHTFWGQMKGTSEEKEKATKATIKRIIEEKTWWNIFTHYKHDIVYEIRVASGEGIRWKKNGLELELIGFLEPFSQELI